MSNRIIDRIRDDARWAVIRMASNVGFLER